jgi:hypothetical protein
MWNVKRVAGRTYRLSGGMAFAAFSEAFCIINLTRTQSSYPNIDTLLNQRLVTMKMSRHNATTANQTYLEHFRRLSIPR